MQLQYKKTPGDGNCCIYAILQNLNIQIEYHHNFREILKNILSNISMTEEQQKQAEGELILKQLQPSDTVVLLDEHGKEYRSIEFAHWLEQKRNTARRLIFIIGGPYGFSKEVYQRANEQVSLSKMTFSHQMIRLTFTEQIYRACTIIKGEPYHHE